MALHRWSDHPVESLNPSIERQLVNTSNLTVARIRLQAGAVVPRHEHPHEQVATVLQGSLRFRLGDEDTVVSAGDSMVVPSGVPHEVEALEDSLVLDVFSPMRDDWARGDDAYLRD